MPNWFLCNYDGGIGDETLPNFYKKKAPKKGREKETRGKDQIPFKQTAQKA
jgi:hypothetical protein